MSLRHPATALIAAALIAALVAVATTLTGSSTAAGADPRLALPPLQAPGEWFDSQRTITGTPVDYAGALDARRANAAFSADAAPDLAGLEWDLLGPTNIGGRVVDLALVPGRPDEVYVATASGGVWKSSDLGTTFAPSWPSDVTQALGAMAATPDGVLLVGTGEANPGGGSIVYGGTGMYRSTDLGATWDHVGLDTSGAFGRIQVDPSNPEVVYAAASGNLFVPGGERGLYRSTDAGVTWELLLGPDSDPDDAISDTTGAVDVAVDPSDPDRILVGMWDHYRDPEKRVYAGPGSGVYLTEDGGQTWVHVQEITLDDPAEVGRIGVAFAPSDPSRAYAIIANKLNGTHGQWFRSEDGGRTFAVQPSTGLAGNNSSYGWWFARIFVDPADADRLYVAGLELIESTDGGATFLPQSNTTAGVVTGATQGIVHADQHAMVWSTDVPGLVYLGNDGGVWRSSSNGTVGSWVGGLSQGWTQHYSVDVDEQTAEYVVSGLQDNLCQMHLGGDEQPVGVWTKYGLCGDGIVTRIDPADPSITYYCSQYGGCGRGLAGAPDLRFGMPSDRYGWLADIQFDPTDSAVIYTAGARLWRSTDRGESWTAHSGDLASPDLEQLDPNPGYKLRGVVTTIAVHPDGDTAWVGTDEGRLWVNRDITAAAGDLDNETWTLVGDEDRDGILDGGDAELGLPAGRWITSITVDPTDPDVAYIAYSGFRQGDLAANLFVTRDGGATFEPVTGEGEGALPAAPINDVILAGTDLVVGTDVGVFLSEDHGATWVTVGDLPAVPVIELVHHEPTGTLTAATFGHGVRRTALPGTATGTAAATPVDALLPLGR
jgi:hypothetical protein